MCITDTLTELLTSLVYQQILLIRLKNRVLLESIETPECYDLQFMIQNKINLLDQIFICLTNTDEIQRTDESTNLRRECQIKLLENLALLKSVLLKLSDKIIDLNDSLADTVIISESDEE